MSDNVYTPIYNALKASEYPVIVEGTVSEDSLPDTYITYMSYYDEDAFYADNKPVDEIYYFRVNLYSKDPAIAQTGNSLLKGLLIPAGFIKQTGGRGLPYSERTGHHGYTCDYEYYKET